MTDEHLFFNRPLGIANLDTQHEAIELILGNRVRPLVLERILRRQYEERRPQLVGLTFNRDLPFAHGFEEGTLGPRRCTVDFVREQNIGEDRSRPELKLTPVRQVHAGAQNIAR